MSDAVVDLTEKVEEAKAKLEKRTLNVKQLAEVLGVGETKARQLCRTKGFPVLKVGNRYLIPIAQLDSWIEANVGKEF